MPKIRVIGLKELQKALNTQEAQAEIKKIVRKNGSELQRKAQDNADFKGHYGYVKGKSGKQFIKPTGNLKRSIGLEIIDGGFTAEIEPTAEYAGYVEVGTRHMDAQPYLKPAYEEQVKQFKSDMQKLVR